MVRECNGFLQNVDMMLTTKKQIQKQHKHKETNSKLFTNCHVSWDNPVSLADVTLS